jgi:DNA polymerase-3 subunit epsilon
MSIQFSVVDTETTGFDPSSGARVIELAVVRIDAAGNEIATWSTLINPGTNNLGATEIHKITPSMVEEAPKFSDIVGDFINVVKGSILVAHNARFDVSMLQSEFAHAGLQWPTMNVADTLSGARKLIPGLGSYKLGALAEHFGISFEGDAHAALADTRVTAKLYSELLSLSGTVSWPDPDKIEWPTHSPSGKAKQRPRLVDAPMF